MTANRAGRQGFVALLNCAGPGSAAPVAIT